MFYLQKLKLLNIDKNANSIYSVSKHTFEFFDQKIKETAILKSKTSYFTMNTKKYKI